ncbi:MAG: hypothetical protein INQ03_03600 [Candidatus Heimdallarchaeota archaeon]|nr:hypothetical protein [Candidatus Heimdallarchaeota archaeon]
MSIENDNSFKQSLNDIKFSWELFKQNARAFISTQIFAVVITVIVSIIFGFLLFLIFEHESRIFYITVIAGFFLIFIVLQIFLTSQYGLAHEIYLSGDMFAEFKGSFKYFRNYWKNYLIMIIVLSLTFDMNRPQSEFWDHINFNIIPLVFIFNILWNALFIMMLPSISNHNSLRIAWQENKYFIKNNFKRVMTTVFLLFLIFDIPKMFRGIFTSGIRPEEISSFQDVLPMIFLNILLMLIELLKFPITALAVTRIYKTLKKEE